jgi:hypothetical protein
MYNKTCKECGAAFTAKKVEAKFCGQQCRLKFTNRRRDRGALLYDVLMNCRYDRAAAKEIFGTNNVNEIMSQIATGWKAMDEQSNSRPTSTWQGCGVTRETIGTLRSVTYL